MRLMLMACAGLLGLSACSDGGAGGETPAAGGEPIRIVGSSTVYPFTTAVAENLKNTNPDIPTPIIESTGTGGGLQLFCSGVGLNYPDVANASRRIKESEIERCRENGVNQIIEVQVGIDGIVFARSREAEPMELTSAEIYRALAGDGAGRHRERSDPLERNRPEPAGHADPRFSVRRPRPARATPSMSSSWRRAARSSPKSRRRQTAKTNWPSAAHGLREDGVFVEGGENDNLIVQKLVADPRAVGIFGYSYLDENLDKIEPVSLNGVEPTYEEIASGDYTAARPLYIYVKGEHLQAKPALQTFLAEYTDEGTVGSEGYLRERGLISLPDERREENRRIAAEARAMDTAEL